MIKRPTFRIVALSIVAAAGMLVAPRGAAHPTAFSASGQTWYFCVVGTLASPGVKRFTAPQPGLACYTTPDEAIAAADDGQWYYCVVGSPPMSYGIDRFRAPQPGLACYTTLDAADAAMGDPPWEIWAHLPNDVNTNIPPPATFDPKTCSGSGSPVRKPGEIYWGRCDNGAIGAMYDRPGPGGSWTVPPPPSPEAILRWRIGPTAMRKLEQLWTAMSET